MQPYAYIPHHIVGHRMRLKVADASPRLLNDIRERLLTLRVQSIETNPTTGSVLILIPGMVRETSARFGSNASQT